MASIDLTSFWPLLVTYLRPQRTRVLLLVAALLASTALQIVNPQIVRQFIDAATAGTATPERLSLTALLFIGIALVQQAVAVGATYVSEVVGWNATNRLRGDLALHCLRLDPSFHKLRTPGELIERIDGDVTVLANFFSQFAVKILGSLLFLAGVLVVLWLTDWRAGIVLTLYILLSMFGLSRLHAVAIPYWRSFRQASADLFGFVEERLAGTVDIRSSGATSYVMRRLYDYTRHRFVTGSRARIMGYIPWGANLLFSSFGPAISFVVAAYLYASGALSLGVAFLIYYYTVLMLQPLNDLTQQVEDFQKAGASIVRVLELQRVKSALVDGPGAAIARGPLSVELDGVTFGYGEDEPVLRDLSFRLQPGERLGLLGRTGSGKTTISRLLFRLYDPEVGQIRLGGVDLRELKLAELREKIGLVTQDVQLFRATVRDNLTLFDRSIGDREIFRALADLGLDDWCRGLPNGLDTVLGAGGSGVSAGEAQLLAFTRVFLKDPGLIILDEASSRLDPVTERLVERAVTRLLVGRTAIIIAHRLGTIRHVDTVMILDRGELVEYGRRETLVADPESRLSGLLRVGFEQVLV